MNPQWGRSDAAGAWLSPTPTWTVATVAIALTSTVAIAAVRYAIVWTPLQRAYLSSYVRSAVMDALGFTKAGPYRLLQVVDRSGPPLALEEELQAQETQQKAATQLWESRLPQLEKQWADKRKVSEAAMKTPETAMKS